MKKHLLLWLLAALLTAAPAMADTWNGSVRAAETVEIAAPADGILESLSLEPGQMVEAEEAVGAVRKSRVFSPLTGTVAAIHAETGDKLTDTVLEIAPLSQYLVSATVADVAKTAETALVHCGEQVWMKCTADGSHRAVGRISRIDGTTYEIETTGGELYVGETVYVYRDEAFDKASLIGKGTVTAQDTQKVTAEGTLLEMRVKVDQRVERGQWLFTTASTKNTGVTVPAAGVVTEILAQEGEAVQEDQTLAVIATAAVMRIEVSADDASLFHAGDLWYYTRKDDPHETHLRARVRRVLSNENDASATVELTDEEGTGMMPIGLTVTITDEP